MNPGILEIYKKIAFAYILFQLSGFPYSYVGQTRGNHHRNDTYYDQDQVRRHADPFQHSNTVCADEFKTAGMPVAIFKHIPNLQNTLWKQICDHLERKINEGKKMRFLLWI